MKKGISVTRKIAITALLTALGLIVFIIENQFPPMFIPGARMGLANVFSFAALIMFSPAEAFLTVCLRTELGAIFAGNVSALMYSFTGGIVSMAVSSVLMYAVFPRVSVIAVSICSAVAHNITQNTVFVVLTGTANMFVYLPYLMLLGIVSGATVGGIITLIFKKVPLSLFERATGIKTRADKNASDYINKENLS